MRQDQPKHESTASDFKASKYLCSKKVLNFQNPCSPSKEWHRHMCSSMRNADVLWYQKEADAFLDC